MSSTVFRRVSQRASLYTRRFTTEFKTDHGEKGFIDSPTDSAKAAEAAFDPSKLPHAKVIPFHQRPHRLYNPPYSKRWTLGLTAWILFGSLGLLTYSVCNQQKKHGFWFKKQGTQE